MQLPPSPSSPLPPPTSLAVVWDVEPELACSPPLLDHCFACLKSFATATLLPSPHAQLLFSLCALANADSIRACLSTSSSQHALRIVPSNCPSLVLAEVLNALAAGASRVLLVSDQCLPQPQLHHLVYSTRQVVLASSAAAQAATTAHWTWDDILRYAAVSATSKRPYSRASPSSTGSYLRSPPLSSAPASDRSAQKLVLLSAPPTEEYIPLSIVSFGPLAHALDHPSIKERLGVLCEYPIDLSLLGGILKETIVPFKTLKCYLQAAQEAQILKLQHHGSRCLLRIINPALLMVWRDFSATNALRVPQSSAAASASGTAASRAISPASTSKEPISAEALQPYIPLMHAFCLARTRYPPPIRTPAVGPILKPAFSRGELMPWRKLSDYLRDAESVGVVSLIKLSVNGDVQISVNEERCGDVWKTIRSVFKEFRETPVTPTMASLAAGWAASELPPAAAASTTRSTPLLPPVDLLLPDSSAPPKAATTAAHSDTWSSGAASSQTAALFSRFAQSRRQSASPQSPQRYSYPHHYPPTPGDSVIGSERFGMEKAAASGSIPGPTDIDSSLVNFSLSRSWSSNVLDDNLFNPTAAPRMRRNTQRHNQYTIWSPTHLLFSSGYTSAEDAVQTPPSPSLSSRSMSFTDLTEAITATSPAALYSSPAPGAELPRPCAAAAVAAPATFTPWSTPSFCLFPISTATTSSVPRANVR